MRWVGTVCAASLVWLAACGDDATDTPPMTDGGPGEDAATGPFAPDAYCPGSEGCADEGDGVLHVGAAMVEFTPTIGPTTDIQTVDTNGNGEFDPFDGDEFDDRNGNGTFDGVWMAGFGNGRAASGVNDPQWARTIVLRYNETTIALASVDCVGFFIDDVELVRQQLSDVDVDYVAVSATHTHEARDTMGLWGVSVDVTGVDPDYLTSVRDAVEQSVRDAVGALQPANVQYATFRFRDKEGGTRRYISDARDPYVIDDEARILRFSVAGEDTTIATLVNFGSHPEYTGDENQLLSSDFPHWMREGIEQGVTLPDDTMVPGVGGIAVFYNGAVGSQIGPGRLVDEAGERPEQNRELAEATGTQMAAFVLEALADGAGSMTEDTAALGFRSHSFLLDIENRGFHVAFLTPLFPGRQAYNWDPDLPLMPGENEPDLRTEIAVVDIGRAQLLLVPGELDPVLFLGGYDGSHTPMGVEVVDGTKEHPPDVAMAPSGPYLRDMMRADADYKFVFGLANDEIGYFVPEYDYELDPINPYLDEAEGDHYEETVSVGISAWPRIEDKYRELLAWTP